MLTSPFRYVKDTYMTLHLAYVTDSLLTWICFLLSFFVLLCFWFFFWPDKLRPGLFLFRGIHLSPLLNISVPEIQLETSQALTF